MSKRRQEKISEEIKRNISQIIQEEIKDPRINNTAVSVTRVDLSNDLSHARIYLSILGDEEKQNANYKAIDAARGYIRTELAHSLKIKHAPDIEFRLDKSIEHGIKISKLLHEIKGEDENGQDQ